MVESHADHPPRALHASSRSRAPPSSRITSGHPSRGHAWRERRPPTTPARHPLPHTRPAARSAIRAARSSLSKPYCARAASHEPYGACATSRAFDVRAVRRK